MALTAPPPAEWWQHVPALLARLASRPHATGPVWYRFGDGYLAVRSEDKAFADRCQALFSECEVPPPPEPERWVLCSVKVDQPARLCLITLHDPKPLDLVSRALRLFGDRGYVVRPVADGGWRAVGLLDSPIETWPAGHGPHLVAPLAGEWRPLVGSLAVNQVLANQPEVLFLHAGALGVGGDGMVLAGPRGAGKTTLSLALASRGHAFLSDELAAIRLESRELLPVRRAASIRPGPRGAGVEAALQGIPIRWEQFPDGSPRLRADARDLFAPAPPSAVPLRWILFLRRFADAPRVEWFTPGAEHVRLLAPVGIALSDSAPAVRGMQLFNLLRQARCGFLDLGEPDDSAAYLERLDEH